MLHLLLFLLESLFILSNLEEQFKLNLQQTFLFSALAWFLLRYLEVYLFCYRQYRSQSVKHFLKVCPELTTTGATVITNLDNTPKSILLWRAIMQWLGGIGILS